MALLGNYLTLLANFAGLCRKKVCQSVTSANFPFKVLINFQALCSFLQLPRGFQVTLSISHHSGQVLSALGQKLHPACFFCCQCGKGLKGSTILTISPFSPGLGQHFLEVEGKPFCIDCYSKEKAEECNSCHMPIVPIAEEEQQVIFCLFRPCLP